MDTCFEFGVFLSFFLVHVVEFGEEIELFALSFFGGVVGFDVFDEFFDVLVLAVDVAALVGAGEKCGLPVLRFSCWESAGAKGDEAGEVLVFGAESVGVTQEPMEGPGELVVAAVHHEHGGAVCGDVGVHGANDAHVVDALGEVWEEFADFDAALAVFVEFEL